MTRKLLPAEDVLTILSATPSRIADLTAVLQPDRLHASPDPGEWSARDVLAHLRACADVRGGCALKILAEDTPTLRAVDPRTWIKETDYLEQGFQHSLHAFATQRNDLVAALEPLGPEGWSRKAIVTGAGKVLERTVLFYADWVARHERPHLKQMQRIVDALRV